MVDADEALRLGMVISIATFEDTLAKLATTKVLPRLSELQRQQLARASSRL